MLTSLSAAVADPGEGAQRDGRAPPLHSDRFFLFNLSYQNASKTYESDRHDRASKDLRLLLNHAANASRQMLRDICSGDICAVRHLLR